jgi:hypothetical protein
MQKVEGSNPFSRFREGPHLQAFLVGTVGLCVCVGSDCLRTRRGPIVGRSNKTPCLQVDSGSSEPKSFCGPAESQVFGLLQPLGRLLLQRHDPADSARRRDTSGRGPCGPSPVSVRNRGVNLDPLRDPGEP